MTIDIDKERADFEAWIGLNDRIGPQSERHGDTYTDNYVGEMWECWQARASAPPFTEGALEGQAADSAVRLYSIGADGPAQWSGANVAPPSAPAMKEKTDVQGK